MARIGCYVFAYLCIYSIEDECLVAKVLLLPASRFTVIFVGESSTAIILAYSDDFRLLSKPPLFRLNALSVTSPLVSGKSAKLKGPTALINLPYFCLLATLIWAVPVWFFCNCWTILKLLSCSSLVVFWSNYRRAKWWIILLRSLVSILALVSWESVCWEL